MGRQDPIQENKKKMELLGVVNGDINLALYSEKEIDTLKVNVHSFSKYLKGLGWKTSKDNKLFMVGVDEVKEM